MATPRFALVDAGSRAGSSRTTWPYGDSPAPVGVWFAWRLLGGNNRELGRSALTHPTVAAARSAARQARVRAVELTPVISAEVRHGQWLWRLDDAGTPVAVSSRTYLRQRECTYNLSQFLRGVGTAVLWATDGGDDGEPLPSQATPGDLVVIDLTGSVPVRRVEARSS